MEYLACEGLFCECLVVHLMSEFTVWGFLRLSLTALEPITLSPHFLRGTAIVTLLFVSLHNARLLIPTDDAPILPRSLTLKHVRVSENE